jgi:sec-independent protein translocase protein TatC
VASLLKRRGSTQFERAADGSMTLVEHLRELRSRLLKASLGILVGLIVGFVFAGDVLKVLKKPYCNLLLEQGQQCTFTQLEVAGPFMITLKIALYLGLIIGGPVWLYQLWAFIAPGLHRHERKWAYIFTAIAAPLFATGAVLAYFLSERAIRFLQQFAGSDVATQLEYVRYIDFVTGMILLFGAAFEFPLVLLLLNVTGMASGRRMLGWWRAAVFICFAFAAVTTPDPGPFGMTAFAAALILLYFLAIGFAFVNDARRRRKQPDYSNLGDDEISPLQDDRESVEAPDPVPAPAPLDARYDQPEPISRRDRFDDTT